jgi:subtilisin family serine protease
VEASNEVIREIEKCAFVDTIYTTRNEAIEDGFSSKVQKFRDSEVTPTPLNASTSEPQLSQLNLLPLHQAGYKGKGIRIGVADGGFYNADTLEALPREQWLGYADFTDDKNDIFGSTGNHGALCLTAIVGKSADYQGAATEAEYFLFRTEEHSTESPKEIDNWVAAIEMADSLGLHIVSTSLGYTTFDNQEMNFTYADMDGKTSRGAQAAAIATRKGMLLVVAMGNDGNKAWHYLSTPADADSILSVGAVDVAGEIAGFSSYGPSADGRVKPEVCAVGAGTALINPADNEVTDGNGTSFACPLIAGMAASLWSAVPKASNMEIREQIIRSADRYTTPHEQYGYGVPNAWEAYNTFMSADMQSIRVTSTAKKLLKNGQLYILHEGKIYDILGHRL